MIATVAVGWDSSRPVPWRRLIKEYVIYAGVMAVVLMVITKGEDAVGLLVGLLAAGPIYFALGAAMAKLGYQRKTLAEMRTPRASTSTTATRAEVPAARSRPAPTRRTSGGSARPGTRPNRRK